MSICHIIGAGEYSDVTINRKENDCVVVCDGGLRYVEKYAVTPDLIVGDFDSLGYVPDFPNVVKLPVKKDVTDVGAAIHIAKEKNFDEYRLYCCGGGRISHTLANVQNLLPLAKAGKRVYLYDKKEVLTILRNGEMTFSEGKGVFSVFAIGKASGVSVSGALYPLTGAELSEDFPLGVSNEFVGEKTVVSVKDGTIIVTFPLHTDLPK